MATDTYTSVWFVGLTPSHHQPTLPPPPPSLQLFPLSSHSLFDFHTADLYVQLELYQQQYARAFHCLFTFSLVRYNPLQTTTTTTTFLISYFSTYQKWVVAVTTKAFLNGRNHLLPTDTKQSLNIQSAHHHHITSPQHDATKQHLHNDRREER